MGKESYFISCDVFYLIGIVLIRRIPIKQSSLTFTRTMLPTVRQHSLSPHFLMVMPHQLVILYFYMFPAIVWQK